MAKLASDQRKPNGQSVITPKTGAELRSGSPRQEIPWDRPGDKRDDELPDGRTTRVLDTFSCFNQPSVPIPAEVTALTGITDEMVDGHSLGPDRVVAFAADAIVVIARNAPFDRKFMERYCPSFERQAWACSVSEIEWRNHGFEGSRLPYLLMKAGLFHEAHRAVNDCLALLEILALELPHHIGLFFPLCWNARGARPLGSGPSIRRSS